VNNRGTSAARGAALIVAAFVSCSIYVSAQNAAGGDTAEVHELQDQVRELRSMIEEMRSENTQSRAEMRQLRQDLQATRALLEKPGASEGATVAAASGAPASATEGQAPPQLEERVQKLEESASLLGSKIDEQYQTKVETASKYRARLHGIVLMNAFRNIGGSDNLDFPNLAQPLRAGGPAASVGATLRQSEIGLELFGPTLAGARTSADVQFDFSGGFPSVGDGVNFGIARLQTASLRMDWRHTSIVAGQDSLFISPLSPTSFASLATPAFAYAGNLWGWTPQLRVEHRFNLSDIQTITLQAGILDNLNWEPPYNSFYRSAQAGELSGQPAYALRTSWARTVYGHPMSFAVAGYYGRQDWRWDRYADAWAGMADWQIPLFSRLSLSGEFYRGKGVGGLGAAEGRPIVYGGNSMSPSTPIRALNSAGGWTQLKLQLNPKLELNGVIAEDDSFSNDVRGFAVDANNFAPIIGRNRGAFGNIVYRPRSDLLLSAELRRLRTFPIYSSSSFTNQVNLAMGILF